MPEREAVILTYHHIAGVESDPGYLSVSPRHFAEHLETIRRRACPVPLERAVHGWDALPDRAVAITLDDGYADALFAAKPLLERYDVAATVFIAGDGEPAGEFWWDELEHLLLWPGELARNIAVPLDDGPAAFDLDGSASLDPETFHKARGWKVWELPLSPRHALFLRLCPAMKAMRPAARDEVMCALRRCAGARPGGIPEHRRLTSREIAWLVNGGLVAAGAHTATHSSLPVLSPGEQREEMRRNRTWLEEILGSPVSGFCYPYGDLSDETEAIVTNEQFDFACSTITGNAKRSSDRHRLPRHSVLDIDGDAFARWLEGVWTRGANRTGGER